MTDANRFGLSNVELGLPVPNMTGRVAGMGAAEKLCSAAPMCMHMQQRARKAGMVAEVANGSQLLPVRCGAAAVRGTGRTPCARLFT